MLGIVVGLRAEATVAARLRHRVAIGGGTPDGARQAAEALVRQGCAGLVSFGLAGGLDPALPAGSLVIPSVVLQDGQRYVPDARLAGRFGGPTGHTLLAAPGIVADSAAKRRHHAGTGAHAVDLESGAVAQAAAAHGLPFVVVRAICDPAGRSLPPAALQAVGSGGRLAPFRVIRSLLAQPGQLPALLVMGREAALARRALGAAVERARAGD